MAYMKQRDTHEDEHGVYLLVAALDELIAVCLHNFSSLLPRIVLFFLCIRFLELFQSLLRMHQTSGTISTRQNLLICRDRFTENVYAEGVDLILIQPDK